MIQAFGVLKKSLHLHRRNLRPLDRRRRDRYAAASLIALANHLAREVTTVEVINCFTVETTRWVKVGSSGDG
jgi:hypothetical protein